MQCDEREATTCPEMDARARHERDGVPTTKDLGRTNTHPRHRATVLVPAPGGPDATARVDAQARPTSAEATRRPRGCPLDVPTVAGRLLGPTASPMMARSRRCHFRRAWRRCRRQRPVVFEEPRRQQTRAPRRAAAPLRHGARRRRLRSRQVRAIQSRSPAARKGGRRSKLCYQLLSACM